MEEFRFLTPQDEEAWSDATSVIRTLVSAGHESYVAGGAVRDALLGRTVHDVDVTTAATPDAVEALFPRTIDVGRAFGVMIVVMGSHRHIEVATFRTDAAYADRRRPLGVRFVSASEDVTRRDFTVNALLLDVARHLVIDHVGGLADLASRTLRAVGIPQQRLAEDRLRILRVLRFSAVLGFTIEEATWKACASTDLAGISRERINAELVKALSQGAGGEFCRLAAATGRLHEITPGINVPQTARLLERLGRAPIESAMAAWLHSLGAEDAARWLRSQPVPAAWRKDVPWLIATAHDLLDLRLVDRRRALRSGRRITLMPLAMAMHPKQAAILQQWMANEDISTSCPLKASDLLAEGWPQDQRIGMALQVAEEAWLMGKADSRDALLAWLHRHGHA